MLSTCLAVQTPVAHPVHLKLAVEVTVALRVARVRDVMSLRFVA